MENQFFADAIGGITLTGALVRMDLVSLSSLERDEKDQPKAVIQQRIIMPVDGFVRSFAVMARVMEQLEKQGVVRRRAEGGTSTVDASSAPKSENFR